MNTIGKILVILNFLFALIVAIFIAMSFSTTTNWKKQIDQLRDELVVARANGQAQGESLSSIDNLRKDAVAKLEASKQDVAVKESEIANIRAKNIDDMKQSEDRAKLAELGLEKALAAKETMQKEAGERNKIIANREDRIVKLQFELTDTTVLANTRDRDLKFSQERNQSLVRRVQELEVLLPELQVPQSTNPIVAGSKDPTALNPPTRFVKGVVEKVDSVDKSLIKISLGTDHGLKVGNTLEVFRTNPTKYIGVLRIEDAHHHTSVGRLQATPGVKTADVREGDNVASGLENRK